MRSSVRRTAVAVGALVLVGSALTTAPATAGSTGSQSGDRTVLVLARDGASDASVRAAIGRAGGTVTKVNGDVGLYAVRTSSDAFAAAVQSTGEVAGVATDRVIGRAPKDVAKRSDVERLTVERKAAEGTGQGGGDRNRDDRNGDDRAPKPEPLAGLQWDMDMIRAPQAHRFETGRGVRVGIMDTGVDGSHPDIAPNFNRSLSRNFTIDDPLVDGPCASDPDGSCIDPADVDENGHGTHVAGTIASPINGQGIAGVAPGAEIVNLRAGQDSGYFFLQPTVDALTYAGRNGIDVVNMSFYIDPWLYNCAANPADTPAQQLEQRTIISATNRALRFARSHGVTLVAAAGNEHTDLNNPTFDDTSPDYPPGTAYPRTVDNSCLSMPAEGDGVVTVSALGPTGRKAYYSNWGTEEITVSAPGGDYRDNFGTPKYRTPGNLILAPMPKAVGLADGEIDPVTGNPTTPFVVRDCSGGPCGYYQYLQGTSMAAPHAVGVAALIIGRYGERDRRLGGVQLAPPQTERILTRTAAKHACPEENPFVYPGLPASYTSSCDGSAAFNGWYGNGVVDALAAVRGRD